MNKLSIIIPVYNVEKYISRCLNSILAIKSIDWECILIDDGSKDNSWTIICDYVHKYPGKFLARQKKNGGVSSARNMGIDIATGDRIIFIDPDDYLFNYADELLLRAFKSYADKDIILFDYAEVYDNKKCKPNHICLKNSENYKKTVTDFFIAGGDSFVWRTIYRTDIIKNRNIRFNINMRNGEDTEFNLKYVRFAKSIALIEGKPFYAYYQREGSAVRTSNITVIDNALHLLRLKLKLIQKMKLDLTESQKRDMYLNIANKILYYTKYGAGNTPIYEFFKQINKYYKKPLVREVFKNVKYNDFDGKLLKLGCVLCQHDCYFLMGLMAVLKVKIFEIK